MRLDYQRTPLPRPRTPIHPAEWIAVGILSLGTFCGVIVIRSDNFGTISVYRPIVGWLCAAAVIAAIISICVTRGRRGKLCLLLCVLTVIVVQIWMEAVHHPYVQTAP